MSKTTNNEELRLAKAQYVFWLITNTGLKHLNLAELEHIEKLVKS